MNIKFSRKSHVNVVEFDDICKHEILLFYIFILQFFILPLFNIISKYIKISFK